MQYTGLIVKKGDDLYLESTSGLILSHLIDNLFCSLNAAFPSNFEVVEPIPCVFSKFNNKIIVTPNFVSELEEKKDVVVHESIKSKLQKVKDNNKSYTAKLSTNFVLGSSKVGVGIENKTPVIKNNLSNLVLGEDAVSVKSTLVNFNTEINNIIMGESYINPLSTLSPSTVLTPTQIHLRAVDKKLYIFGNLLMLTAIIRKLING